MSGTKLVVVVLLSISFLIHLAVVAAYDLRTHGGITGRAFDTSSGVAAYLEAIGIKARDIFDPDRTTPFSQLALFRNTATPRDWMIEGTIREDDFQPHRLCDQPKNPPSKLDRS